MYSQILFAAQQPLTAVGKKATSDYVTQIRTDFNTELAKQHTMNTELYTGKADKSSFSSAEAFLSAWGWSPGLGTVDLTAPGPIGSITPNTGKFTTLQADSLNIVPPSGETGEMAVHEDPASSGDDWVGFKAPVNVAPGGLDGDLLWVLPSTDGTAGQVMATDGASNLSWVFPLKRVTAPTAADSTCTAGSVAYDTSYIYVCIASNTWLRGPISTW